MLGQYGGKPGLYVKAFFHGSAAFFNEKCRTGS